MEISTSAQETLRKLDPSIQPAFKKAIEKILAEPQRQKPLHGHPNAFRARIGGYRIVYTVEKDVVQLKVIGKRDGVYRHLDW